MIAIKTNPVIEKFELKKFWVWFLSVSLEHHAEFTADRQIIRYEVFKS